MKRAIVLIVEVPEHVAAVTVCKMLKAHEEVLSVEIEAERVVRGSQTLIYAGEPEVVQK